jgi:hypothetical protein
MRLYRESSSCQHGKSIFSFVGHAVWVTIHELANVAAQRLRSQDKDDPGSHRGIQAKDSPPKKKAKEMRRCGSSGTQAREQEDRTQIHPEHLALYQQSIKGNTLKPRRQHREEHAGAAEERAEREARRKQTPAFRRHSH